MNKQNYIITILKNLWCFIYIYADMLYKNLYKSKVFIVTSLDLAKTFDTVIHEILLKNCIICNYLQDRQRRVKIKGNSSYFIKVDSGVLQGTIWVLYFLYFM